MRARIAGEGDQRLDLAVLDAQGLGHGMQKPATGAGRKWGGNSIQGW
jgi:hypothetical protein